ncbi:15661_t:CDS:1 [Acaulospora morrowiae]|uniref:15661_t:CDS:1 n=1 Tax=Acaulospora morrowiae TaxID=94023 RepID=A0A9N8WSN8_9GLOM|nr:15661_t:CDS:1 [Acaulospora morrowiae]
MPEVIRPLGILERFYVVRQNVRYYRNVAFTVKYQWNDLKKTLNKSSSVKGGEANKKDTKLNSSIEILPTPRQQILKILYPTLSALIQKLPSLSMTIRGTKTSGPLFIQLEEIDLSSLVTFVSVASIEDLGRALEEQHDLEFDQEDESKPLWRILIGICDESRNKNKKLTFDLSITFVWHHILGDGMSSIAIHGAFFEILKKVVDSNLTEQSQNLFDPLIKVPSNSTTPLICPPLEQRLNIQPTLLQIFKEASMEYLVPSFLKKHVLGKYWAGDVHSQDILDFHSRLLMFSLTPEEFEDLVVLTKKKGTTINSVLHTAMIFSAIHNLLSDKNEREKSDWSLRTSSPISLRSYASPQIPLSDIGNYVTKFEFDYRFDTLLEPNRTDPEPTFWKLCHTYRSKLISSIPHAIGHVGMLNYLAKDNDAWETFFRNQMESLNMGRSSSLALSNLGKFPMDLVPSSLIQTEENLESREISKNPVVDNGNNSGLKIVDMLFSQSPYKVGPAICIHSVCYNKKLNLSVVYQKGVIADDKKVERFGEGILKCLRTVSRKGDIEIGERL